MLLLTKRKMRSLFSGMALVTRVCSLPALMAINKVLFIIRTILELRLDIARAWLPSARRRMFSGMAVEEMEPHFTWEKGGWSQQRSVAVQSGGQGYYPGSSPTAIVQDDNSLRLFWVGSGGPDQGSWSSNFAQNPYSWTDQRNLGREIGGSF